MKFLTTLELGLNCRGPSRTFDTHIDICCFCHMSFMKIMSYNGGIGMPIWVSKLPYGLLQSNPRL